MRDDVAALFARAAAARSQSQALALRFAGRWPATPPGLRAPCRSRAQPPRRRELQASVAAVVPRRRP